MNVSVDRKEIIKMDIIFGILFLIFLGFSASLTYIFRDEVSDGMCVFIVFLYFITILMLILWLTFFGQEGYNREQFLKHQQEYIVLQQYIQSNRSESILESSEMLKRITDYNNFIIEHQNNMTRPFLKYYEVGVDWNELKPLEIKIEE